MAVFTSFTDILPDPNNSIGSAGQTGAEADDGTTGPGFANVTVVSKQPIMRDTTNSGRILTRAQVYHRFEVSIKYNPLLEDEFNLVHAFVLEKQSDLTPFFVSLPHYRNPLQSNMTISASGIAGATYLVTSNDSDVPIGGLFTITDTSNSNHTKVYMVTRMEDEDNYNSNLGVISGNTRRIHFTPGLQAAVSSGATMNFQDPLMKVVTQTDSISYSLDSDGLYNYQLRVEEVAA